jgi:hypothetical protein
LVKHHYGSYGNAQEMWSWACKGCVSSCWSLGYAAPIPRNFERTMVRAVGASEGATHTHRLQPGMATVVRPLLRSHRPAARQRGGMEYPGGTRQPALRSGGSARAESAAGICHPRNAGRSAVRAVARFRLSVLSQMPLCTFVALPCGCLPPSRTSSLGST